MTTKQLRALERRMYEELQRKAHTNANGVQVIQALAFTDKPDDVNDADWQEFWEWRILPDTPPKKDLRVFDADEFTHFLVKRKGRYSWEDAKTGELLSTDDMVRIIKEASKE